MLQANANNTNVSKQESLGEVPWEPCLIYCDVAGSTYLASKDGSGELSSDLQPEESRSSALFASFNVSNPGSEANIDLGSSRLYPGPATEASVLSLGQHYQRSTLRCLGLGRCALVTAPY
jgi:hypothetical protein